MAVRLGLMLTALLAGGAYLLDSVVAHGLAMGGIAGVLVFWVIALRVEKLANAAQPKVHSLSLWWTLLRYLVFGLVIWRASLLDTSSFRGILGAVAGLFIIQGVIIFLGMTGLDRRLAGPSAVGADGEREED